MWRDRARAAGALSAMPQAMGDADCAGGYYYDSTYRLCGPLGFVYQPGDLAYDPANGYYLPGLLLVVHSTPR